MRTRRPPCGVSVACRKNLHAQQNVDLAIFGVGAFGGPIPSHVYSGGYFEAQEQRQLRELGVVGDMCTILLREDGLLG